MPFSTYSEIRDAIILELARDDLLTKVPDWIRLAEIRLQRDLGLRHSRQRISDSFTDGVDLKALPADLLDVYFWEITSSSPPRRLYKVSEERLPFIDYNDAGSIPLAFALLGASARVAPTPGTGITYDLTYKAGITALSVSNPTNELLDNAPDALFFRSLLYSAPFLKDDSRMTTWALLAKDAVDSARKVEWNAQFGGQGVRMRPPHWVY